MNYDIGLAQQAVLNTLKADFGDDLLEVYFLHNVTAYSKLDFMAVISDESAEKFPPFASAAYMNWYDNSDPKTLGFSQRASTLYKALASTNYQTLPLSVRVKSFSTSRESVAEAAIHRVY